jgi:hypothetical protein
MIYNVYGTGEQPSGRIAEQILRDLAKLVPASGAADTKVPATLATEVREFVAESSAMSFLVDRRVKSLIGDIIVQPRDIGYDRSIDTVATEICQVLLAHGGGRRSLEAILAAPLSVAKQIKNAH